MMSKVKVTVEYDGEKQEFESDFVIMGSANIEEMPNNYSRIGTRCSITGIMDMLSLNRVYVTLAGIVHEQNIKEVYGVGKKDAYEMVKHLTPEVNSIELAQD